MIRRKSRVIRHTHICIASFLACILLLLHLASLVVSKVGKPRWGHPLVEFVIVGKICRKKIGPCRQVEELVHARAFTHTLKGRPREMRTVNLV